MDIVSDLKNQKHEHKGSALKELFYASERKIGNLFFKAYPPSRPHPRLLNLGCGPLKYKGWINADEFAFKRRLIENTFKPDWSLDITSSCRCHDNYFDGIFTQHVLEHVSYSDAVHVLSECFRTLRPHCWIRIIVPSLDRFIDTDFQAREVSPSFPNKALAVSCLTQMHGHKSTWDNLLLEAVLIGIGFESVNNVSFGKGSDARLLMDQIVKKPQSLYFEAMKP